MSGYVSFNVHAHGDTIVSIYTGGLCVIAHKEKKKRSCSTAGFTEKYLWRNFFFFSKKSPLWNCLLLENEQFLVAVESRISF